MATFLFMGAALAAPLGGKPGLWESTTTSTMEGGPTQMPDTSRMTPAQRDRMAQSATARGGSQPTVSTTRQCITPQMLEKWETFTRGERDDPSCQRKMLEQTDRQVKMAVSCGGGKSTGNMEFVALSADRVSGKMVMVMHGDGADRKLNVDLESRWIGADCGGLKPGERRRVVGR